MCIRDRFEYLLHTILRKCNCFYFISLKTRIWFELYALLEGAYFEYLHSFLLICSVSAGIMGKVHVEGAEHVGCPSLGRNIAEEFGVE